MRRDAPSPSPGRHLDRRHSGSGETEECLLPIDAKFPIEDYDRLQAASEIGGIAAVEEASKALESRIKNSAKDISSKYIRPPKTTDFEILFPPTEGLYATITGKQHVVASGRTLIKPPAGTIRAIGREREPLQLDMKGMFAGSSETFTAFWLFAECEMSLISSFLGVRVVGMQGDDLCRHASPMEAGVVPGLVGLNQRYAR
ncbi:DNA recombination protein RmuC [Rhizobium leguminosarum]|uniref:DNA recombination protein RmuC n=1 Tax=Rhizobium leguminosarum TaxID=384 RepID=UPI0004855EC5|nr:DNA recombination protein RmuC [Rhizobium leguminosarum]